MFDDSEEVFIELANAQRLDIIHKLREGGKNLSLLSKELKYTMQEVHRNLNRLTNAGLIEKNSNGTFALTTFGNTIITQIPSISFLSRNKTYFSDHTFGDIPMKFVQRIGALNSSTLIQGLVAVIEKIKDVYTHSNEYVYGMIPQVPLDIMETIVSVIQMQKIRFNYILPKQALVPKRGKEMLKEVKYTDLLKTGMVERKMIDVVKVGVILNETTGLVMFPSTKGDTDMSNVLYSSDTLFHEWCQDFFRYNWIKSRSFDEEQLRVV